MTRATLFPSAFLAAFAACLALAAAGGTAADECPGASGRNPEPYAAPGLERLRVGGSNYISYGDIAAYHATMRFSRAENRYRFDTSRLRPIVATYHLAPETVARQLRRIAESGQEMIALMIYFTNAPAGRPTLGYRGHMVIARDGALLPRQRRNLEEVARAIRELGFTRLIIRLAPQGRSSPYLWKQPDERRFAANMAFIESVAAIATRTLAGSATELLIDLGAEQAGVPKGGNEAYIKRVWRRVCRLYADCERRFFVSFNPVPPAVQPRIALFHRWIMEANGRLPRYWAFDVYGYGGGRRWPTARWDVYRQLADVFAELRRIGQADKPVILQEVFYDDPRTARDIRRFARTHRIRLDAVIQWPNSREAYQRYFEKRTRNFASVDYPASYCRYAALVNPVSVTASGAPVVSVVRDGCMRRGPDCRVRLRWRQDEPVAVTRKAAGKGQGELLGCGRSGDVELSRPSARTSRLSIHRRASCAAPAAAIAAPVQTLEIRWN